MKNILIDLIKDIAFFIINGWRKFIYLICSCFKIDNKKVFVNYFDGRGIGDHPKYIVKELIKECPNIKIYWVYRGKKEAQNNIIFVKPFSVKAIFHQATAKIWISSVRMPFYSIKKQKQYYFQSWHGGLAFKKIEQECEAALSKRYKRTCKHDSKMIDYWISSNADNTRLYKNFFWYHGGEILEVGSPRNDIFFKNNDYKLVIYPQFKDFKWILFAPTYREKQSNIIEPEKILQAYKKKYGKECIILIREHPSMKIENLKYNYSDRIFNVSEFPDTQLLLAASDILITDYSSIMWDFSLQEKPVILFHPDAVSYSNERQFYLSFNELPYFEAFNMEDVCNYIISLDTELYKYKSKLHDFFDKYESFDYGTASDNVVNIINELSKEM